MKHRQSSSSSMATRQSPPKNRIILLLIELFVGAFGFDRMYMGSMHEGLLKLGLFLMGLILLFLFPIFGLVLILAWAAWAFFDTVVVVFNALTRSNNTPWTFGKESSWGDEGDNSSKNSACMLAIFILLMEFGYIILIPLTTLSDGKYIVNAMKFVTDAATKFTTSIPKTIAP